MDLDQDSCTGMGDSEIPHCFFGDDADPIRPLPNARQSSDLGGVTMHNLQCFDMLQ